MTNTSATVIAEFDRAMKLDYLHGLKIKEIDVEGEEGVVDSVFLYNSDEIDIAELLSKP